MVIKISTCREKFADYNGKEIYAYTVDNNIGLSAKILNHCGRIQISSDNK